MFETENWNGFNRQEIRNDMDFSVRLPFDDPQPMMAASTHARTIEKGRLYSNCIALGIFFLDIGLVDWINRVLLGWY